MELTALNETAPAVEQYAPGTLVEIDAGGGQIVEAHVAPNGQVYYVIDYALPDNRAATCTRWHDEIALHPIDAAVMAIADDEPGPTVGETHELVRQIEANAVASALVTGGAPSDYPGKDGDECRAKIAEMTAASQAAATAGIDDKFRAMLDKGAAIIASIDTIRVGDLVVLKSGGPQMIVEKVEDVSPSLVCWWMDHTANLHVARFTRELVELVPNHAEMRA